MTEKFIGELYKVDEEIMYKFQATALKCGMAITIMPRGNGTYRIELMKNETEDAQ